MVKSGKELAQNSLHYLDFAGAALPSPQFLQRIANLLSDPRECLLANPHSGHMMGRRTRDKVQNARAKILAHFGDNNLEEFAVIFTSNATNALKLLAENFGDETRKSRTTKKQFSSDVNCLSDAAPLSTLLMLRDSHTSVLGMRSAENFERIVAVTYEELNQFLAETEANKHLMRGGNKGELIGRKKCLFVMTAMSNFCGRVYDMELAHKLKRVLGSHWFVCLDSAALAPHSSDIGLSFCDFAVISFYKMFGYPSVEFREPIEERFEDGTCNFHAISALLIAFEESEQNQIDLEHSMHFAKRAFDALSQMKHPNGAPIAIVYGEGWTEHKKINSSNNCARKFVQGPIVNFNLLRDDGSFVGFVEVDKMADLFGIQLRTGCHCNLGACSSHLGISEEQMMAIHYQSGKECGDDVDLFDGKPLGSVRVSFGLTSSEEDLAAFLRMLECSFCGHLFPSSADTLNEMSGMFAESNDQMNRHFPLGLGTLTHLFVYPIKSCAAMAKKSWPICPSLGTLLFDRHWLIVSSGGDPMTQKRCSALCLVVPEIDTNGSELMVKERNNALPAIKIEMEKGDKGTERAKQTKNNDTSKGAECIGRRRQMELVDFGGECLSLWLSELDPLLKGSKLMCCPTDEVAPSNFSNKANFLLISRASALFVASRVSLPYESVVARFRPNFVVDFGPNSKPFEEENIEQLAIGSVEFSTVGICQRCQMICIDQKSGEKDPKVLVALRNLHSQAAAGGTGKLSFGIYLEQKQKQNDENEGDERTQTKTNPMARKKAKAMAREMRVGCAALSNDVPIDKETRSILWRMLKNLHKHLAGLSLENESQQQTQMPSREQGQRLISAFNSMAQKLKDEEIVQGSEVEAIFAQIDAYLVTVHTEQRQKVIELEQYKDEKRLEEAMRREKSKEWGELNEMLDQQKDNEAIFQFVSHEMLKNIRIKLEEIALFHFLTNAIAQKKYKEYFKCFSKREELKKKKTNAEKANEKETFGFGDACATSMLACSLCNVCESSLIDELGICSNNDCVKTACHCFGCLLCPAIFSFTLLGSFTTAFCCKALKGLRRKKVELISKRIEKLDKAMGEQLQQKRGKQLLLENGPKGPRGEGTSAERPKGQ
ncbi:hypothetical protein niasHT_024348 [Heterodera trifolii]|uniref:MOSC domain-containing protein n=1 Tax=Heterodera trifolii TaxID=157864 RepID=A0ABD2JMC5_9BILA